MQAERHLNIHKAWIYLNDYLRLFAAYKSSCSWVVNVDEGFYKIE